MKLNRCFALGLAMLSAGAFAQDRADIDKTRIVGNRELPKVLYIVPWKKPLPGVSSGKPLVSVLDEAMAPIDRDVFRRQVQYDTLVQARAPADAAPSLATSTAPSTSNPPSPSLAPSPAPSPTVSAK